MSRTERKGRTWHLSAATYRLLGDKAAYVRSRGFEPLQQEQMVLQYVEKHGRITRGEIAELCRLSPDQAYRLLARLCEDGRLMQQPANTGSDAVLHVTPPLLVPPDPPAYGGVVNAE